MSSSLDEWFDGVFCRPVGNRVADLLEPTPITADAVTFASGALGVLAGVCFAGLGWWPLVGGVVLLGVMILDCVDGELARRRGGGGWRGRILDGLADLATAFSIHLGMLIHLVRVDTYVGPHETGAFELFMIALVAGAAMSWNCAVVDDVKQRLKERSVDQRWEEFAREVDGPWDRFLYWTLKRYVRWTSQSAGPGRPGGIRCFRLAQWVGPTHHHLAIAVAGALTPFWEASFLVYLLLAIIPANIWLLTVLAVCREGNGVPLDRR